MTKHERYNRSEKGRERSRRYKTRRLIREQINKAITDIHYFSNGQLWYGLDGYVFDEWEPDETFKYTDALDIVLEAIRVDAEIAEEFRADGTLGKDFPTRDDFALNNRVQENNSVVPRFESKSL